MCVCVCVELADSKRARSLDNCCCRWSLITAVVVVVAVETTGKELQTNGLFRVSFRCIECSGSTTAGLR